MGYTLNQQVYFISFSPYFLLFGHNPKLLASMQCDAMAIMDLDEKKFEEQVILFWSVTPMATENLTID